MQIFAGWGGSCVSNRARAVGACGDPRERHSQRCRVLVSTDYSLSQKALCVRYENAEISKHYQTVVRMYCVSSCIGTPFGRNGAPSKSAWCGLGGL